MTRSGHWLASAAVIALTLGVTSRADIPAERDFPLPPDAIILAAEDSAAGAGQTEDTAEDSAKMGKEERTHEGAQLDETPETESDKIDQPKDQGRTAGDASGDKDSTQQ
ncbi:MAG: hypothetical protein R6X03_03225 [Methyloceanibacter sp.]